MNIPVFLDGTFFTGATGISVATRGSPIGLLLALTRSQTIGEPQGLLLLLTVGL